LNLLNELEGSEIIKYVIDTNSLLEGSFNRKYEKKYFPVHWKNFEKLWKERTIVSIELVLIELTKSEEKRDEIYSWAEENKDGFISQTEDVKITLIDLFKKYPGWSENSKANATWADGELVAFAKTHSLILVTEEKIRNNFMDDNKNSKIPDLCKKEEIECIDFLELIKKENLHES